MNLQSLVKTILSEGGLTYSMTYGTVSQGYAVCQSPEYSETIATPDFNNTALQNFINLNSEVLSSPDTMVGAWVYNGSVVLDVVTRVTRKDVATKLAKANNQLAYYDLNNQQVVFI